jgi:hypothetical protein
LGKLERIASDFHIAILRFGTIEQVHRWVRWLAAEQRIEDRKLALAERFHAAVISARWTLPPAARTWDRGRGRPRTWDEDGWE